MPAVIITWVAQSTLNGVGTTASLFGKYHSSEVIFLYWYRYFCRSCAPISNGPHVPQQCGPCPVMVQVPVEGAFVSVDCCAVVVGHDHHLLRLEPDLVRHIAPS